MLHAPFPAGPRRLFCVLPLVLALAACGGGSGDKADPVAPSPTTPLTVSGTAATGAAIAGGVVAIKCNGGSDTATSGADGNYSKTLAAGALPCVLQVTAADGTVLHSLATGSGSAARANITPVSELVLAQLSGGAPASYFTGFDAAAAAALSADKASAAVAAVVATLQAAGVDLTATGDVLTGALVAASGSTAGNAFDQKLDALKARLAATGTTLATLTATVAKGSPAAPATALSSTASLPAEMLLQPKAATCSALRSGRYRVVTNGSSNKPADGTYDTEVVTLDAVTLQVVHADLSTDQLTANGNCRFKDTDGGDIVVSPAGVIVFQAKDGAVFRMGIGFPEQTHPLSALAGDWNSLQLDRTSDGGPIVLTNATWTLDTAGKLTAITFCENGLDCESGTAATAGFPVITSSVSSDGGFNWANATDGWTERTFLYRSGGGELLRVNLAGAGSHLGLSTRKVARPLPETGTVSETWNITQNNNYTASGVSESKNTIRSIDATANGFLRDAVTNFTTGATRPETFRINNPRDGFSLRMAETVTASDGSSSAVTSFIALGLRGTGVSAVGFPGNNTLVLSVSK